MRRRPPCIRVGGLRNQRGLALMVMTVVLALFAAGLFVVQLSRAGGQGDRNLRLSSTLGLAKESLTSRAVLDANRPGSLPCPDLDGDGSAELLSGNQCPGYLGRLPWRTLGSPDLRDPTGERLWYALSPSLRDDDSAEPINSSTPGQLALDGLGDVAAIVFAPGSPVPGQIQRPGNTPGDFLEGANVDGDTTYSSAPASPAFNDAALPITRAELMAAVERRVSGEAIACLRAYALSGNGRYPWAAPVAASGGGDYSDAVDSRFGRLPETLGASAASGSGAMPGVWPAECSINQAWWQRNGWRELLFYAVAESYAPAPAPPMSPCASCLSLSSPTSAAAVRVVALSAGQTLAGQSRATLADKAMASNYLEGGNATAGDDTFERRPLSIGFNDAASYLAP